MQVGTKATDTNHHWFCVPDNVTYEYVWICDGLAVAVKVAKYVNINWKNRLYKCESWCEYQLVTLRAVQEGKFTFASYRKISL